MTCLHITSGDIAGKLLAESGIAGEVFVWHDVLYDGPRNPGWPEAGSLIPRAKYIEDLTGGGLEFCKIRETLETQYAKLETAKDYARITLWFDACLFDQSMLAHVLTCLKVQSITAMELVCVDAFPGIEPFNGLGQLTSAQLASTHATRQTLTPAQFAFAERVDAAFARQDRAAFLELAACQNAPLRWVPAAVRRWLQELGDEPGGLGRLEQLALEALHAGAGTPGEIYRYVAAHDSPPQYWGDITLWAKLNKLADRTPPLIRLEGPSARLPQWDAGAVLKAFTVQAA